MVIRQHTEHSQHSPDTIKLLIIVCVTTSTAIILAACLAMLRFLQRRRKVKREFNEACLHNPDLTWEEFQKQRDSQRLPRSRSRRCLLFEEELQRTRMIRKSQQSRASDCQVIVVAAEKEEPRTESNDIRQNRSRTWHDDRGEKLGGHQEMTEKSFVESTTEVGTEWAVAQATVERTWQLLHGRGLRFSQRTDGGSPLVGGTAPRTADAMIQRPPTVRPKTPPLLSHPLFRDGNEQFRPKHMSLPMELTRAKCEQQGP
ncbi:hypothetical protein BD289DRAFT_436429 [Coniella lustricola]|uniref:Uncharacterized protein n=1 Tax=Coniella lustricola TaxID=2025994 RepID=A0A2T3A557_9PEZI|nr:hypothetical protein BD289DRAFT_436429 [Coniella lustricola]